jgi:hypothetical protein
MTLLSEELFYQLAVRRFGDVPRIKLHPPPKLKDLIAIAVEAEEIPSHGQPVDKIGIIEV